jgi:transcriptional regulator GlxA family with amidase domain
MVNTRSVGILIFDDVEVLDFCGPFEVFSVTVVEEEKPFNVFTVAESRPITARNGLSVNPTYLLDEAPSMDILLIPGDMELVRCWRMPGSSTGSNPATGRPS